MTETYTKFPEFTRRGRECGPHSKSLSYVSSPLNPDSGSVYFIRHDKFFLNCNELEAAERMVNAVKVVMRLLVIGTSSSGLVLFGVWKEQ